MDLTLTPQMGLPGQPETSLSVMGDVLTVDDIAYDFSSVPEGGEAQPEEAHPFAGPITRQGGVLRALVVVRLGPDAADDQPDSPWTVTATGGPVTIPAARKSPQVPD